MWSESIRRGNFTKYLFLGVWSPGKLWLFLQNVEKALLENLICLIICSNEILEKISWKFWSVLMIFLPPGKCVLAEFWESSPGNFYVSSTVASPGKFSCFSIFISPTQKSFCFWSNLNLNVLIKEVLIKKKIECT